MLTTNWVKEVLIGINTCSHGNTLYMPWLGDSTKAIEAGCSKLNLDHPINAVEAVGNLSYVLLPAFCENGLCKIIIGANILVICLIRVEGWLVRREEVER